MVHNRTILNGKYKMEVEIHEKSKMVTITGRAKIFEIREVLVAMGEELEMAAMKRRTKKNESANPFGPEIDDGPNPISATQVETYLATARSSRDQEIAKQLYPDEQDQQPLFPDQDSLTAETAKVG